MRVWNQNSSKRSSPSRLSPPWLKTGIPMDNQWSRVQEIIGRQCGTQTPIHQYMPTPRFTLDLNAMDINRLSTKQITDHIKKDCVSTTTRLDTSPKNVPIRTIRTTRTRIETRSQIIQQCQEDWKNHLCYGPIPCPRTQWRRTIHFPEPNETKGFLIKQPVPTSKSLNISSVLVANVKAQSMHLSLPLRYKNTDGEQIVETPILLNSGAEGLFINQTFVEKNWIPTIPLLKLIIPWNIDRTTNQSGKITHCT